MINFKIESSLTGQTKHDPYSVLIPQWAQEYRHYPYSETLERGVQLAHLFPAQELLLRCLCKDLRFDTLSELISLQDYELVNRMMLHSFAEISSGNMECVPFQLRQILRREMRNIITRLNLPFEAKNELEQLDIARDMSDDPYHLINTCCVETSDGLSLNPEVQALLEYIALRYQRLNHPYKTNSPFESKIEEYPTLPALLSYDKSLTAFVSFLTNGEIFTGEKLYTLLIQRNLSHLPESFLSIISTCLQLVVLRSHPYLLGYNEYSDKKELFEKFLKSKLEQLCLQTRLYPASWDLLSELMRNYWLYWIPGTQEINMGEQNLSSLLFFISLEMRNNDRKFVINKAKRFDSIKK